MTAEIALTLTIVLVAVILFATEKIARGRYFPLSDAGWAPG